MSSIYNPTCTLCFSRSPARAKMLWRQRTKCTEVCVTVALLLALHWMQTEASPLKKNIEQDGQKEGTDTTDGFQRGLIVFGDPTDASAEVDPSFQADNPGSGAKHDFFQMNPLLWCGNKQMKFTASGKSVGHFTLKQKPPLPLSNVPPACGYTIEGFPYRLVLHVPYDGCNIDIEGGYYNLPMLWNGYTVKLMCPRPDDPPTATPQHPVPPQWYLWYYWYYWYLYYHMHQIPYPSMPTTSPNPQAPMMYWYHMHKIPYPSMPTTSPNPQDPMMYWYHMHKIPYPSMPTTSPNPQDPMMYWYHMHKIPYPTLSPTTDPPADPLPQVPQKYWHHHHMFPQQQLVHKYPQLPQNPLDPQKTTPASTTMHYCPWCNMATT